MLPVILSKKAGSPEEFFRKFTNELKKEDALVAAFLAYDFGNYEIVEMLTDPLKWAAVDTETGKKIVLFYIDPENLLAEKKKKLSARKEERKSNDIILPTSKRLRYLCPLVIPDKDSIMPYIEYLLLQLKYDEYSKPAYPFLLFVKFDGANITDNFSTKIKYKGKESPSPETACNGLLKIIHNITLQLSKVEENCDKDTVFNLVKVAAKDSIFELIPTIGKTIYNIIGWVK